jgi:hypothetical protein
MSAREQCSDPAHAEDNLEPGFYTSGSLDAPAICPACGGECVWILQPDEAAQDDEDARGDDQYQQLKEDGGAT